MSWPAMAPPDHLAGGLVLIAVDRIAPQRWRNGGGATRELWVWPSEGQAWQCRISVADIDADGPFSSFPGIERWFAVVEGDGVVLALPGERRLLDPSSGPIRFDGADAPGCSLQGGPTRDLNLMVRRDAGHGGLEQALEATEWISAAPVRALFTTVALTLQIDDADAARLPPWTLALSTHAAHQRWRITEPQASPGAWWLSFQPRPPAAAIDG